MTVEATTPVVSITVPTYNRAGVLPRALRSLLLQTFEEWEATIVDDGSADDTEAVVRSMGDPRFVYVRRAKNGGVAAATQTGLEHARGTFFGVLHSDDEWLPDKLRLQVAALKSAPPGTVAAETGMDYFSTDRRLYIGPTLGSNASERLLGHRASGHLSAFLFMTSVAKETKFDLNLRGCEDWDFTYRISKLGGVVAVASPQVVVHQGAPDQLSRRADLSARTFTFLMQKHASDLARRPGLRAVWHFKLFKYYLECNDTTRARSALLASVKDAPTVWQRWVLVPGALLKLLKPSYRAYERLARLQRSLSPRSKA